MKNLIAIIIALALPCFLLAQTVSINYPLDGAKSVSIEFQYGDITVEKYDGNEIVMSGLVKVNGKSGVEYFDFNTSREGNKMILKASAEFKEVDRRITIIKKDGTKIYKDGKNISIEEIGEDESVDQVYNGMDIDAKFTLQVPNNVDLNIETVYGSMVVKDYWQDMRLHSTYGSVDVVIKNPPSAPVMKVSSTYSEVDVSLPANTNASINMSTSFGRIYTDMDLKTEFNDYKKRHHGQDISAKLNGGKGSIKLDATYSNIYLRKTL